MKKNLGKFAVPLISGGAALAVLLTAGAAFAQSNHPNVAQDQDNDIDGGMMHVGIAMKAHMQGIFGTVASVNGSTITVTSKGFGENANSATYTVDASSATVVKDGASSSISSISVGDTVMVKGTVSGTSVTATAIFDGVPAKGGFWKNASSTPGMHTPPAFPQGNGEPVIGGTVTAIGSSTLTVTNASNLTYAVNASNATVFKGGATSTLSSVSTGDRVVVQGAVNGSSVTASSIIDQGAAPSNSSASTTPLQVHGFGGFFGAVGGFFRHLFGFF